MYKAPLYKNPLSRFAGVMASTVFVIAAVLLLLDYFGVTLNPIIGMLAYTLFPGLLFFYLLLIPIGMYREWRRRHRVSGEEPPQFPRFDFNLRNQRVQLYVFIVATSLVGLLVLAISFRTYEMTESVEFCSELCHKVMGPESATYKVSPHAHVACVQCHVGEGATWYVKSKISGLYQVYATLFKKYPTPIETPVHSLRPSMDTCEKCHWPSKFYGSKSKTITHYQEDEKNTPRQFRMLLNIGGGVSPTGIHWHVGQDEVHYIARDKSRQDIPWIKVKHKDGREVVYNDTEKPLTDAEIAKSEVRKMDCLDCHNRPTHIFKSPKEAMDNALVEGRIDEKLPYAKKIGVELLSKQFETVAEADSSIEKELLKFYAEKYPDQLKKNKPAIDSFAKSLKEMWSANNFPHMKSNWSIYPNNIGHLSWVGCFRCHDEKHKNAKNETVKKDCSVCHIFLEERLYGILPKQTSFGISFMHPIDVGGEEKKNACNTCHQGM